MKDEVGKNLQVVSYYPYFTYDEYKKFITYKHNSAGKSKLDEWWRDNYYSHWEKALPQSWSANTLTLVGNAFPISCGIISLFWGGFNWNTDPNDESTINRLPW